MISLIKTEIVKMYTVTVNLPLLAAPILGPPGTKKCNNKNG
jgi:hypothetical protein